VLLLALLAASRTFGLFFSPVYGILASTRICCLLRGVSVVRIKTCTLAIDIIASELVLKEDESA